MNQESIFRRPMTPTQRTSTAGVLLSPWHPIHASTSEDMWELPSNSSSLSSSSENSNDTAIRHHNIENFYDHHRYHNDIDDDRNEQESIVSVMNTHTSNYRYNHNYNRNHNTNTRQGESSTSRLFPTPRKKFVLGDATNLHQTKRNTTVTAIPTNIERRSYFN